MPNQSMSFTGENSEAFPPYIGVMTIFISAEQEQVVTCKGG